MKIAIIDSNESGYMHEAHKANCRDLAKKVFDTHWVADNLEAAKIEYEGDNETYEAEGGPGNGYYWEIHVRVFPCTKEAK
jgi:hypothetical protein